MGLFDFIDKAITKVGNAISSTFNIKPNEKVVDVANKALAILTSPIDVVTKGLSATATKTASKSTAQLLLEGTENVLVATAPLTSLGKSSIATAAKYAYATPLKSVITTTALGAAAVSPTILNAGVTALDPVTYIGAGATIGEYVEKGSDALKSTLGTAVGEAGAGFLATGAVLGAAALIGSELGSDAATAAGGIIGSDDNVAAPDSTTTNQIGSAAAVGSNAGVEAGNAATTGGLPVSKVSTSSRKKKKKKINPTSGIRITNKNFINNKVLVKGWH